MSIIFYRDFEFLSFDFSLLFNVLLCEMDRCSDRSLSRDLLRFCVCLLLCFRGVLLRDRERPMFARFHISQNTRTHKQTRASANTPSTYNYNHTILVSNKFVFTAIKYICTKINSQGNIDIHFCDFARYDSCHLQLFTAHVILCGMCSVITTGQQWERSVELPRILQNCESPYIVIYKYP